MRKQALLFIPIIICLIVCIIFGFKQKEEENKYQVISNDIVEKKQKIEEQKEENKKIEKQIEDIKIEKKDLFKEYEVWQHQNQKLIDILQ